MAALRVLLAKGENFHSQSLSVDDLREIARLNGIRKLGTGEIASMVVARKLRLGLITDDGNARQLLKAEYPDVEVRTTSHLVGHLIFVQELGDSDVKPIIDECAARHLAPFITECWSHAQMLRLRDAQAMAHP